MLLDVGSSNTANESKSKTRSSADRKWVGRDTNLPIKEHIPLDNTQKEEKQVSLYTEFIKPGASIESRHCGQDKRIFL